MKRSQLFHKARVRIAGSLLRRELTDWLAGIIIFFSATQLGFHFWPKSAFVYGLRVDYLSPTLYFLDILLAVYLAACLAQSKVLVSKAKGLSWILPLGLVNLLFSVNPIATLSWVVHCMLYLGFVVTLSREFLTTRLRRFLVPAMLIQVALAALQVGKGGSLQGIFYWLGERALSVSSLNVAKTDIFGEVVLRAYGTFSHPNTLAGWLVISLLILTYLSNKSKLVALAVVTGIGVALTGSRAAAVTLVGVIIPFFLCKTTRSRLVYFGCVAVIVCCVLRTGWLTRTVDLSTRERLSLQQLSLKVITDYPLFGTGANASITTYPTVDHNFRLLQPDHNSFTLLLSWFGLAGLTTAIYLSRSSHGTQWSRLIPLLPLLLLDHYLLTSPQGLLILFIYLKVASARVH